MQRMLFFSFWFALFMTSLVNGNEVREYCESETFQASCGVDEVIVMKEARYGRMSIGRCTTADYGYIGCYKDALSVMDALCSGKRSCDASVVDLLVSTHLNNPCPMELKSYLEASYECKRVVHVSPGNCQNGHIFELDTSQAGRLIMSSTAPNRECPYRITASPYQKIQLSVMVFSHQHSHRSHCTMPGIIMDSRGSVHVCVRPGIRTLTFQDLQSNVIQLRLNEEEKASFAFTFQVTGCPDPETPLGGMLTRVNETALVQCNFTDQIWHLTCTGNQWDKQVGNCSKVSETDDSEESVEVDGEDGEKPTEECGPLEVPNGYSKKEFENTVFLVCEETGEYSIIACEGNEWVQRYPMADSLFVPLCI